MPATKPTKKSAPAAAPAATPAVTFTQVMDKAAGKDRANLQRHLDEITGDHAKTWKTLVANLATLAPQPVAAVGKESIRFFVADGRYRFQLFALEDTGDGQLRVYLPNVEEQALKRKLIAKTGTPGEYTAKAGAHPAALHIDLLDGNNTSDAPPHFKYMIGLNRKALRVTLPAAATGAQLELLAALCDLAAQTHAAAEAANVPK